MLWPGIRIVSLTLRLLIRRISVGRKDAVTTGARLAQLVCTEISPISPKWTVPGEDYFDELKRVSKHYIVWGCNYFDCVFPHGRIVWDKCNGASSFSDCELAATNCHNSVRLFRYTWNGMLQGKSVAEGWITQGNKQKNEVRIHPTQKPVALYEWIFSRYAKPGDKILDTHLGSGSSRIAAYNHGLDFIGCEIHPHYFQAQEDRFVGYTRQARIIGV